MNRDDLHRMLEQLRAELASADPVDAALRARLLGLQGEINDALGREVPQASLRGRLEDGVVQFETSHPTLARRLAEAIDTLALYGL